MVYRKKLTEDSPYKDKVDAPPEVIISSRALKLGVEGLFTDKEEIKLAKELEKKYLTEYNIETISDKNLLYYLIYLEVLHIAKLQKSANEFTVNNNNLPIPLLDAIHRNINQIVEIKDRLGLNKKEEVLSDAFQAIELLKKKFKVWGENNQASRTIVCPHCSQMVVLKMRASVWEAQKHPFFKDRLLGNEHLIRLYQQGKLSKEDVASILGTSNDYTEWLIKKWKVEVKEDLPPKTDCQSAKISVETEEVKPESSVIPLTVDSTSISIEENVSLLNGSPEIDTITK